MNSCRRPDPGTQVDGLTYGVADELVCLVRKKPLAIDQRSEASGPVLCKEDAAGVAAICECEFLPLVLLIRDAIYRIHDLTKVQLRTPSVICVERRQSFPGASAIGEDSEPLNVHPNATFVAVRFRSDGVAFGSC